MAAARKSAARKTTARKAPAKTAGRKTTARKTTARKAPAAKATARKTTARKTTARKTTARKTTAARASAPAAARSAAPPAGSVDLASGLRNYLGAIDLEVRAVSALSERIDALVSDLNSAREEQSKRLIVLDELRGSVSDNSLGAFLDQAIKPRKTRVVEVVPKRLR